MYNIQKKGKILKQDKVMATGRTISASFLTEKDKKIIELCHSISDSIVSKLDEDKKKEFLSEFGKISASRDAGVGLGAGKLQRDALCTRGITSKGPFSNRNLRWHPLIVAQNNVPYAKTINEIKIDGQGDSQTLVFVVDIGGKPKEYPADKVHELPERFCVPYELWQPHIENLRFWNDTLWTRNSCVITAYEACNWGDAVESYAVLALSVVCDAPYNLNYEEQYNKISDLLRNQTVDTSIVLPTNRFPSIAEKDNVIACPLCKQPHSSNAANQETRERPERFNLSLSNKRGEGDDNSMQIMHISPLIESEMRHNASNVRFGHRWCNVSMTDHSIAETINFMNFIVNTHNIG